MRQERLERVLDDYEFVDIADLDLQGEELKVLRTSIEAVEAKIRKLHIGTHSHEIDRGLRRLLGARGWRCTRAYGCLAEHDTPYGRISFVDGVQTWRNPRL